MRWSKCRASSRGPSGGILAAMIAACASLLMAAAPALADDGVTALQRVLNGNDVLQTNRSALTVFNSDLTTQGLIEGGEGAYKGKVVYLNDSDTKTYNGNDNTGNYQLQTGCVYVVTGEVTFQGGTGKSPGAYVAAPATGSSTKVIIYIAPGAKLHARGGAGTGYYAGQAGIRVPAGVTLEIVGKGELYAYAGNGGRGNDGKYGYGDGHGYNGGDGGAGGGGGGAGIGTDGGYGGWFGTNWQSGFRGNNSANPGAMLVSTSLSAYSTRSASNGGGGSGGPTYSWSTGGGGGGGGGGGAGNAIGAGGAGGGGGGCGGDCEHGSWGRRYNGGGAYGGYGVGGGNNGGRGGNGHYHNYGAAHGGWCGGGGGAGSYGASMTVTRATDDDAKYTITFDVNHTHPQETNTYQDLTPAADTASWTRTVMFGETSVAALEQVPTRTGYEFLGFYTKDGVAQTEEVQLFDKSGNPNMANLEMYHFIDASGNWTAGSTGAVGQASGTNVGKTQDFQTTIYARWKAREFSVLFDATGGSSSLVKTMTYLGSPVPQMSAPERPGYNFQGFYMSRDKDSEQVYNENMEYVKKFNGEGASSKFVDYCDGTVAYYGKNEAPAEGGSCWNAVGSKESPQRYVTYYAHWEPVTYYLQFNSWDETAQDDVVVPLYNKDGSVVVEKFGNPESEHYSVSKQTFGEFVLPSNTDLNVYRNHYIFKGWNTFASQDWKMYVPNKTYKGGLGNTQDAVVQLYAAWEPQGQVDIIYEGQGADGNVPTRGNPFIGPEETYSISDKIPTKSGYTFLGWNTASDGSDKNGWYCYEASGNKVTKSYDDPGWSQYLKEGESVELTSKMVDITEGMTLYAIWAKNPTITYNPNGGVGHIDAQNYSAGTQNVAVVLDDEKVPVYEGHTFAGWSEAKQAGEGDTVYKQGGTEAIATMPDADVVLYAQWDTVQLPVTAEISTSCPETVQSDDQITFAEWKDNEAGTAITKNKDNTLKVPYGNSFLFSVFVPSKYNADGISASANGSVMVQQSKVDVENGSYYVYRIGTPREDQNIVVTGIDVYEYKINFVTNGGSYTSKQEGEGIVTYDPPKSYVYGTGVTLPTAENIAKTGFEFEGWYEKSDFTGDPVTEITENDLGKKTFYAKWTAVSYAVRYHTTSAHPFGTTPEGARDDESHLTRVFGDDVVAYGNNQALRSVKGSDMFGLDPSKVGSDQPGGFLGWAKTEGNENVAYLDGQRTSSFEPVLDGGEYYADLYAIWMPDYVTVVFDTDGGSAVDSLKVDRGATVTLPTELTKEGYTFAGWKKGDKAVTGDTLVVNEDTTLVAQWTGEEYTVTFNANNGTNPEQTYSQEIANGAATALKAESEMSFTAKKSETRIVKNWAENAAVADAYTTWSNGGQNEVVLHQESEYGTLDSGTVVKYKFEAVATDSDYYREEGDNYRKIEYVTHKTTEGVCDELRPRDGGYRYTYTSDAADMYFIGWGTSAGATEVAYYDQQVVTDLGNTTLYALWADEENTNIYVSFDANEGAWSESTPQALLTTAENKLTQEQLSDVATPTRVGYTFGGWSTTKGGTDSVTPDTEYTASTTLYAIWTPITYQIVFHGGTVDGPEVTHTQIINYDAPTALDKWSTFTEEGFAPEGVSTLKGWSNVAPSSEGDDNRTVTYVDGQLVFNLQSTEDAVVDLYPLWKVQAIVLAYDTQGGSAINTITGLDNEEMVLPGTKVSDKAGEAAPTREGYKFLGWYTYDQTYDASGNRTYTDYEAEATDIPAAAYPAAPADSNKYKFQTNTTLYAWWQKVQTGTVTYYTDAEHQGTYDIDDTIYTVGDTAPIMFDNTTTKRFGYTFVGWKQVGGTFLDEDHSKVYTSATHTVKRKVIDPRTQVETEEEEEVEEAYAFAYTTELAFEAQWEAITYNVQYVPGNENAKITWGKGTGETADDVQTFTYGVEGTLETVGTSGTDHTITQTPTGKHFAGWSTQMGSTIADYYYDGTHDKILNLSTTQGETVLLYGVWQGNEATLHLKTNHEGAETEEVEEAKSVQDGQGYPELTKVPEWVGHTFKGYYELVDDEEVMRYSETLASLSADAISVKENGQEINLYAKWEIANYTVKYMSSKGVELLRDSEAKVDQPYTLLSASHFPDITLEEGETLWWVVGSYDNNQYEESRIVAGTEIQTWPSGDHGISKPVKDSTVLVYAYVTGKNSFAIEYNSNGGTWQTGKIPAVDSVKEAMTYNVKFDEYHAPTRKGYEFAGWSRTKTNEDGTSSNLLMYDFEHYKALSQEEKDTGKGIVAPFEWDEETTTKENYAIGFTPTENTILYAIWKPMEYVVTYDGNGGTLMGETDSDDKTKWVATDSEGNPITYGYDEKFNLSDNSGIFENGKKEFKGWGTNKSVMRYEGGETVKELTDESDITLYAIWTNYAEHTLTAVADGEYTYDAKEHILPANKITVRDISIEDNPETEKDEQVLEFNKDYTLQYADYVNAGDATVTVTGIGDYNGNSTFCTYKILPSVWTDIADIPDETYNFSEHKPKPVISWVDGDNKECTLVEGVDYELEWSNNTNVARDEEGVPASSRDNNGPKVTVTGLGNFVGQTEDKYFVIQPLSINSDKLTVQTTDKTYNGEARTQDAEDLTVAYGEHALTFGTDYDIDTTKGTNGYENNVSVGDATVHIKGIGNFCDNNTGTFKVEKAQLDAVVAPNVTYNGKAQEPELVVTAQGDNGPYTLSKDDYEVVKWEDNKDAGTAMVTVKSVSPNIEGEVSTTFDIAQAQLSQAIGATMKYTGSAITLGDSQVTVRAGEDKALMLEPGQFTIVEDSYENNTEVSTDETKATFTVTAVEGGNYTGSVQGSFTIVGQNVQVGFNVENVGDQLYTRSQITPEVKVTDAADAQTVLEKDKSYLVTYGENVQVGENKGTIHVVGIDEYAGNEADVTFDIVAPELQIVQPDNVVYNTKEFTPTPKVTCGETELTAGTEFTYVYENNVLPSKLENKPAKVIAKGVEGTVYEFSEAEATFQITVPEISIAPVEESFTYNSKEIKPTPKVTCGDTELVDGTDFTYAYEDNILPSKDKPAKVIARGKEGTVYEYSEDASATFEIKAVTIAIEQPADVYWTGDPFTPEPKVTSGDAELVAGTDFEYTYEDNVAAGTAKVIATGKAGTPYDKSEATATFRIVAAPALVVERPDDVVYNGSAFEPTPKVEAQGVTLLFGEELTLGEDYELSYANNKDVGEATVTVRGINRYKGCEEATVRFKIKRTQMDMAEPQDVYWAGEAIEPKPVVTSVVPEGGELVDGTDFDYTYQNNDRVGTATVTATGKRGTAYEVAEPVTRQFEIVAAPELVVERPDDVVYNKRPFEPTPKVEARGEKLLFGKDLTLGEDYTLEYVGNVEPGTAKVIVKGIGAYAGCAQAEAAFEIRAVPMAIEKPADVYWTGQRFAPTPKVTSDETILESGTDFDYAYGENTEVGTATVTAKGREGTIYAFSEATAEFEVVAAPELVVAGIDNVVYTGGEFEPTPEVTAAGKVLTKGEDYELSYANNRGVGEATVTVSGINRYAGCEEATATFEIERTKIAIAAPSDAVYTGNAIEPKPAVTSAVPEGGELVDGTDFVYTYQNNTAVGTATVMATGKAGTPYEVAEPVSATFEIERTRIAIAAVEGDFTYTGKAIEPTPVVTSVVPAGGELAAGDFEYAYQNNTAVGTATVTATGKVGTAYEVAEPVSTTFEIVAPELSVAKVADSFTYTGGAIKPTPKVTSGNAVLVAGTDFAYSYKKNLGVGTATVTVTGRKGTPYEFSEPVSTTFEIVPTTIAIGTAKSQVYTGHEIKPAPRVTSGDAVLAAGTDFEYTYQNNVSVGTATVTATGKAGTAYEVAEPVSTTFEIVPTTIAMARAGDVTYTGREVRPTPKVTSGGSVLTAGTDFDYTYESNVEIGVGRVTATGRAGTAYEVAKPVTTTFKIVAPVLAMARPADATYLGKAIAPTPKVTSGGKTLRAGTDFTYSYRNNVKVGTATVTATGKAGTIYAKAKAVSTSFKIKAAPTLALAKPADVTYTGAAFRPTPKVTAAGKALKAGTDFKYTYKNNVKVGTATVTATGINGYAGCAPVSKTFKIKEAAASVSYRTHVQTYGWQAYVKDGAMSGTSGESKRLEGINIKLAGAKYAGSIQYRTHVQTYGWQAWKANGAMSGTSGESKRLEAIQIKLTGEMAQHYDVFYRVHCQTYGWMGWAKNGAQSGSAGYSKRLEGIQVVVMPKGQTPGNTYKGISQDVDTPFVSNEG